MLYLHCFLDKDLKKYHCFFFTVMQGFRDTLALTHHKTGFNDIFVKCQLFSDCFFYCILYIGSRLDFIIMTPK